MSAPLGNGTANSLGRMMGSHTTASLKRWSCANKDLPPVSKVKAVHVYDFDNTLFMSPLPNPKLWTNSTIGFLQTQDCFTDGGWWHDQNILGATGQGVEKEEPRAWDGWWNDQIVVKLVELSMRQKDAVTILLTGRGEHNFAELIKRMVISKNLEFDMICLKQKSGPKGQRFSSTMHYKQSLLEDLIYTYKDADEIKIYEDRPKQTKLFREFFEKVNRAFHSSGIRRPITAEVIQVAELSTALDPVIETAEIQRLINNHNISLRANDPTSKGSAVSNRLQIKRTIFFTAYLIQPADSANLLSLISIPQAMSDSDVKYLATHIVIVPRPASQSVLDKVGGLGAKQMWQVTGTGIYENKVWAARVTPIPQSATIFSENQHPIIVLATRKGGRPVDAARIQNWQPVPNEKQFLFETTVGEKVQLRIDREIAGENEFDSLLLGGNNRGKRKNADDGDERPMQGQRSGYNDENKRVSGNQSGNHRNNRDRNRGGGGGGGGGRHQNPQFQGRGGRSGNRGGGGGGAGRNRGRGGYRSLDDVGNSPRYGQGSGYQNHQPNYDDAPSQGLAAGGDGYNAQFSALGSKGGNRNGNGNNISYGDGGGLPYQ